jgi:hypothetical protein
MAEAEYRRFTVARDCQKKIHRKLTQDTDWATFHLVQVGLSDGRGLPSACVSPKPPREPDMDQISPGGAPPAAAALPAHWLRRENKQLLIANRALSTELDQVRCVLGSAAASL